MSSPIPDSNAETLVSCSGAPVAYTWIQTADGSPSLCHGEGESMHSRAGAFSETRYIYQPVIEEVLREGAPLRLLVVGLGLGYIEIMVAAVILSKEKFHNGTSLAAQQIELISCEADPSLRELFQNWILGESTNPAFAQAYEWILQQTAQSFELEELELRARLRHWLTTGQLALQGTLEEPFVWEQPFSGIFFDAYSAKTSPELWDENFLIRFYEQLSGPFCATATYACTGALKRALALTGFQVEIIPGFSGKRQSTLARKRSEIESPLK